MHVHGKKFLPVVASLLAALLPMHAENSEAPSPLPKTVAVAAFKNGLAFVVRAGEVPLADGVGRVAPIPDATLGTLWLAPGTPGARLDEMIASHYKIRSEVPIDSLGEILEANGGKTVTINYQSKDYTGEVIRVQASRPATAVPRQDAESVATAGGGNTLLLRVNGSILAFPLGAISMANLPGDAVLRKSAEQTAAELRFRIKGGSAKEALTMVYLEHGIGWTPSYLFTLSDDKQAQITMQAVVTNDAEDVKDAQLYFVVGVPNFANSNMLSPMTLQQSLVDSIQKAARDRGYAPGFSNALSGQMVDFKQADSEASLATANAVDDLKGAPEEDLFLYSRAGVTLNRGERASYNVFSGKVEYEHLYTWDSATTPFFDQFGSVINNGHAQSMVENGSADRVWHSIRFNNTTNFPLTSAPALVMAGNQPVSQDTLTYTPKGAFTTLRLTVATDVQTRSDEHEVARHIDPSHRPGYSFQLVTVEGRMTIKNYKSKGVHLLVHRNLRGKVTSQSDEGTEVEVTDVIESENPTSNLSWDLRLKAGEERVLTYRYTVWIR